MKSAVKENTVLSSLLFFTPFFHIVPTQVLSLHACHSLLHIIIIIIIIIILIVAIYKPYLTDKGEHTCFTRSTKCIHKTSKIKYKHTVFLADHACTHAHTHTHTYTHTHTHTPTHTHSHIHSHTYTHTLTHTLTLTHTHTYTYTHTLTHTLTLTHTHTHTPTHTQTHTHKHMWGCTEGMQGEMRGGVKRKQLFIINRYGNVCTSRWSVI